MGGWKERRDVEGGKDGVSRFALPASVSRRLFCEGLFRLPDPVVGAVTVGASLPSVGCFELSEPLVGVAEVSAPIPGVLEPSTVAPVTFASRAIVGTSGPAVSSDQPAGPSVHSELISSFIPSRILESEIGLSDPVLHISLAGASVPSVELSVPPVGPIEPFEPLAGVPAPPPVPTPMAQRPISGSTEPPVSEDDDSPPPFASDLFPGAEVRLKGLVRNVSLNDISGFVIRVMASGRLRVCLSEGRIIPRCCDVLPWQLQLLCPPRRTTAAWAGRVLRSLRLQLRSSLLEKLEMCDLVSL